MRTALLCVGALAAAAGAQAREVTDLAGRKVNVPDRVERILLGEGRFLPALAVLERGDPLARVVGMMGEFEKLDAPGYAQWRARFPKLDAVPRVGRAAGGSFSVEQAIALRPQLAIFGVGGGHGPAERDRETIAQLQAAGTAIVFIDLRHDPLVNTPKSYTLLGEILGRQREAAEFVAFHREQLARVTERLAPISARPSVFLENRVGLNEACCDTMVGLMGKLLDAAGGSNIARGRVPGEFGTLSLEYLIEQQPSLYIGTAIGASGVADARVVLGAGVTPREARASLERALKRPGLAQLKAVREKRAFAIWHHFYSSPFNVVAVQAMAKWVHPQLFADLDPQATLATMYQRFQPMPLDGTYWIGLQ